jgi:rhodanese-related sulfurtransferase
MGKTYDDYVREALQIVTQVPVADAVRDLEAGPTAALFLDVREPQEIAKGAIPGALVIPRGRLESDAPDWIFDPEGRVVCYCNTGKRSALAVKTLLEMGFPGARSLQGGLNAWQAAGGPLGAPRPM